MHRRGLGLLLLFVPLAQASPGPYPMEAHLEAADPLQARGVLVAADAGYPTLAWIRPEAGIDPSNLTILSADHVRLVVERFAPVQGVPSVSEALTTPGSGGLPSELRSATIYAEVFVGQPEFRVSSSPPLGLATPMAIDGADCAIQEPVGLYPFPEDPQAGVARRPYTPGREHLVAECSVGDARADVPALVEIYGVKLWIEGWDAGKFFRESVLTGTFQEPILGGLPLEQTVTQILRVHHASGALEYGAPWSGTVRFLSRTMVTTGTLSSRSAIGDMTWGAWTANGTIPPFEARGIFVATGQRRALANVSGTTFDPPPFLAASEGASGLASPAMETLVVGALLAALAALAWAAYARIARERLLEHPRRARILQYLEAHPGSGLQSLARELGLGRSAALYHLWALSRGGRVVVQRVIGRNSYFPANVGYRGLARQVALVQRGGPRRVYALLASHGPLDQAGVVARLGVSQPRASVLLKQLQSANLVEKQRVGRSVTYSVLPIPPLPSGVRGPPEAKTTSTSAA